MPERRTGGFVGAPMRLPTLCLIAFLAACSRQAEQQADHSQAEAAAPAPTPAPPAENVVAVPVPDQRSPEAAVAVLRAYFAAIEERRYGDAYRLWSDGGRPSGMSEAAFAASFASYRDYRGRVGEAGRMEGAAGSSYIDLAANVTGTLRTGERFKQSGTVTLRRVNDVPGATSEQLQWRIYRSNLEPATLKQ